MADVIVGSGNETRLINVVVLRREYTILRMLQMKYYTENNDAQAAVAI